MEGASNKTRLTSESINKTGVENVTSILLNISVFSSIQNKELPIISQGIAIPCRMHLVQLRVKPITC